MNENLIGSADAAKILGKSQRTVLRLVEKGELTPAMTVPGGYVGVYLFNRADIEALANGDAA